MPEPKSAVTVQVVPLGHHGSAELSTGTTVADRLSLVEVLTCEAWALAQRPTPTYPRGEMPVRVIPLARK